MEDFMRINDLNEILEKYDFMSLLLMKFAYMTTLILK